MVRRPPHILVTTPESLFILLTAERSRAALRHAGTVIVDEIHALADDKRGSHLALTLARLDDLVRKAGGPRPQRVGLSATVRPIDAVARFLQGSVPAGASERPTAAVLPGPPSGRGRFPPTPPSARGAPPGQRTRRAAPRGGGTRPPP